MSRRPPRGVLLCEDAGHEHVVRRLLTEHYGWKPRSLRVESAPPGLGDASAWVIENFSRFVRLHRSKANAQPALALVAVVDGDSVGLNARVQKLLEGLEDAGGSSRRDDERIAILVPCRNIHTWIVWGAGGENIDEQTDYKPPQKSRYSRSESDPLIKKWSLCTAKEAAVPDLNSTAHAIEELARVR